VLLDSPGALVVLDGLELMDALDLLVLGVQEALDLPDSGEMQDLEEALETLGLVDGMDALEPLDSWELLGPQEMLVATTNVPPTMAAATTSAWTPMTATIVPAERATDRPPFLSSVQV